MISDSVVVHTDIQLNFTDRAFYPMAFSNYGHDTHAGNVRSHNEDSYEIDMELGLSVLADGMGGHAGGEVASRIVVASVCKQVRDGRPMAEALVLAHHAVLDAAKNGKGRDGMGATALATKVGADGFEVVWVGDSRAYIWSDDQLTQLTKDHSLVQRMVDEGTITPAEARVHPQRNYVTQALGMSVLQRLEVGRVQGKFSQGQQLLLCSDGLTSEVSLPEIEQVLKLEFNEQQKVDLLVQKALDNGGSDNVTVLLVSAPADASFNR
jgi:protein phosphatase